MGEPSNLVVAPLNAGRYTTPLEGSIYSDSQSEAANLVGQHNLLADHHGPLFTFCSSH